MARIKYSALIDSINGSIGGTTFQRNRYGFTAKNKPVTVNPQRPLQVKRKTEMVSVAQLWGTLTEPQRAAWRTFADNNPRPTRLNPDAFLNGFNYFEAYHLLRWVISPGSLLVDPNGPVGSVTGFTADIFVTGGVMTWEPAADIVGSNWAALVYLTGQMKTGQLAVSSTPRFIDVDFAPFAGAQVITAPYLAIFGVLPTPLSFIGFRATCVKLDRAQWIEIPKGRAFVDTL